LVLVTLVCHNARFKKCKVPYIYIGSLHFREPFLSVSSTFSQPSEPFSPLKTLYFFTEFVPYPSENSALIIFAPSVTHHCSVFQLPIFGERYVPLLSATPVTQLMLA